MILKKSKSHLILLDTSKNVLKKGRNIFNKTHQKSQKIYHTILSHIDTYPLRSFFIVLFIFFLVIVVSNILRAPSKETPLKVEAKVVETYHIGSVPRISMQSLIEKSGVVTITAQTAGVVQKKYVKEGSEVKRGQWLVLLSSNLQGGNALAVARNLAEKQNTLVQENYPNQKDLIGKQRDLAQKLKDNTDKLRDIASKSHDDTQSIIDLNNTIIASLDSNIQTAQASGSSSTNSSLILASQQMKSQFQSANLQLNSSLRNLEYQSDANNPPSNVTFLQKDITLKQLDIQEKALDLGKEISTLQVQLTQVNEALMYPSAPFEGRVERVFVKEGQIVSVGTPLFTLSGSKNQSITATLFVSKELSSRISMIEPTQFMIGAKSVSALPNFISHEATSGNLYSVLYNLPTDSYDASTDKGVVTASVPIGYPDSAVAIPYIPIDAVYQTQNESFIYVVKDGKALSKKIMVGDVAGRFVSVYEGLGNGDEVILNRSVVDGDHIQPQSS